MLINTVVMFLQELLPVMLLISVLLAWHRAAWRLLVKWLSLLLIGGLLLLSSQLGRISGWADGFGLEFVYVGFYLLCFLAIAIALWRQNSAAAVLSSALACASLCWVNGSNLVIYFFLYQRASEETANLLLGAALGFGIGGSMSVLLYYLVRELIVYFKPGAIFLLAILGARQLSVAAVILVQTDVMATGPVLWSSHHWIAEQSEYGRFLHALMGYEATPTASQLASFLIGCCLLWMLGQRREVAI